MLSIANIQIEQIDACQIWGKILKTSNWVHMARFGMIIARNRSHQLWEASGMPRGTNNHKIMGFWGLGVQGVKAPP